MQFQTACTDSENDQVNASGRAPDGTDLETDLSAEVRKFDDGELTRKGLDRAFEAACERHGMSPRYAEDWLCRIGRDDLAARPEVQQEEADANPQDSDHRVEDADHQELLSAPTDASDDERTRRQGHRRWPILVASAVFASAAVGGGIYVGHHRGESADVAYLTALRTAGSAGQFSSDANAIAAGKSFCRGLEAGGKQQGTAADQLAVNHYCKQFAQGFHVLQKADVSGSLDLTDYGYYSSGISSYGDSCSGSGGYSDIDSGTTVLVKDDAGKLLATTALGSGSGSSTHCSFSFNFSVTEGEDDYVVTVSHRGEQHYTFSQLQNNGVHLSLG